MKNKTLFAYGVIVGMFFLAMALTSADTLVGSFDGEIKVNTGQGGVEIWNLVCGDGIIMGNELCDGDLNGQTCTSLGYSGGILSCTNTCTWDFSFCTENNQTQPPEPQPTSSGGSHRRSSSSSGRTITNVTQNLTVDETPEDEPENTNDNEEDNALEVNDGTQNQSGWSRLTGAVIGALKNGAIIPIVLFIMLLVLALIAVRMRNINAGSAEPAMVPAPAAATPARKAGRPRRQPFAKE